jgi:hypothetical protein
MRGSDDVGVLAAKSKAQVDNSRTTGLKKDSEKKRDEIK